MDTIIDLSVGQENFWKLKAFEPELAHVSENFLPITGWLIAQLPDYFFHVAASSTGKYHPSYTSGDGGLLRHTKAAVRIAIELMRTEMYSWLVPMKDVVITALILHDGWKHGPQTEDGSYREFTDQSHARICAEWVHSMEKQIPSLTNEFRQIADLILTHMGQWNVNTHTGEIFAPKPQTQEQCFVHLCDYLASRKMLEVNFDVPFGG